MASPAGEPDREAVRLEFDTRLALGLRGSVVTTNTGPLACRELDDARTAKNGRHAPVGALRLAVCGWPAGYGDVDDAERLRHEPAMRSIVAGKAASGCAARSSQMGHFGKRGLTAEKNLTVLADLSGQ